MYVVVTFLGWAGVLAVIVFKGGGISSEVKATHVLVSEMRADAKEHVQITNAHGERIAKLEAKDDVADRIADALTRNSRAA
jgi:hypothetical protein